MTQLDLLSLTGRKNVKLVKSELFFFNWSFRKLIFLKKNCHNIFLLLKDKLMPHSLSTAILIFLQLCGQPHSCTARVLS